MANSFGITTSVFLMLSLCRSSLAVVYDPTSAGNGITSAINSNIINWTEHTETSTMLFETDNFPSDCSQRQKRKTLYKNKNSRLKKCCPIGQALITNEESESGSMCGSANIQLTPNLVNVTLYDNCIEDMETDFSLPLEIGNPCNTSLLYNDEDDLFLIAQDGSLLVMDLYANNTYVLYNSYCVEINYVSGITYAFVCINSAEDHISRSKILAVAILMIISIPCHLLVSYLRFRIKELRSMHGAVLSCMSASLAIGFSLYSLLHLCKIFERNTGYAVQFFMLLYYFELL